MGDAGINLYQMDTLIQLNVIFYDTLLNLPADPTSVSLFMEDPFGTVTQPAGIVRTGTGTYYCNFLPTGPGEWTYKWQGTGSVIATSRDTSFIVVRSSVIAM